MQYATCPIMYISLGVSVACATLLPKITWDDAKTSSCPLQLLHITVTRLSGPPTHTHVNCFCFFTRQGSHCSTEWTHKSREFNSMFDTACCCSDCLVVLFCSTCVNHSLNNSFDDGERVTFIHDSTDVMPEF